jgi:hypothetical protein
VAQIISITSEALQATIRRLLPSQQGFGEDLQATNVITPVIDITRSAEGSEPPESLQFALAFGSQTSFNAAGSSQTLANAPGFYRVYGTSSVSVDNNQNGVTTFALDDGVASKNVWRHEVSNTSTSAAASVTYDFVIFLSAGDTLTATTNVADAILHGSTRQVADVNGNLTNPVGFTPQ